VSNPVLDSTAIKASKARTLFNYNLVRDLASRKPLQGWAFVQQDNLTIRAESIVTSSAQTDMLLLAASNSHGAGSDWCR